MRVCVSARVHGRFIYKGDTSARVYALCAYTLFVACVFLLFAGSARGVVVVLHRNKETKPLHWRTRKHYTTQVDDGCARMCVYVYMNTYKLFAFFLPFTGGAGGVVVVLPHDDGGLLPLHGHATYRVR